jgi:2-dehydropantoate 2-reductase
MRIAVLGAGAVGGYFGGLLARGGHQVVMLARGEHLEALRRNRGIEVRDPDETYTAPVEAVGDAAELGAADYALVAVKNYSLQDILPAVRRAASAGAVVVPLLNGVEVTDRLEAGGVPRASLLGGLTTISAALVAPGVVERRSPFQDVVVGELAGGGSPRAERIVGAIQAAGGAARVSPDIAADIWRKFAFISAMAAACGLARSHVEPLRRHPLGRALFERAVGEAIAVGGARGVAVGSADTEMILHRIEALPGAMRPSYLRDLEAGGPTELDDLCGAVARLGRQAGVATPVHDTATAALGVYEASRQTRPAETPPPAATPGPA